MEYTHMAYSDESTQNASKFGSICLITGSKEIMIILEEELKEILRNSDVREFKFGQINSGKMIHCGLKIVDKIILYAKKGKIRVDVLIWCPEERSRHLPENSKKVFGKMYYHLLNNVLGSKWDTKNVWIIYPDKQSLINWGEMKEILENTDRKIKTSENSGDGHIFEVLCKNNICNIEEVDSIQNPICQAADLFAGVGASGHLKKENLTLHDNYQLQLGGELKHHTNKDVGKIRIISYIRKRCGENEFKIDFSTNKGTRTLDPTHPINFWPFKHTMQRNKNKSIGDFS